MIWRVLKHSLLLQALRKKGKSKTERTWGKIDRMVDPGLLLNDKVFVFLVGKEVLVAGHLCQHLDPSTIPFPINYVCFINYVNYQCFLIKIIFKVSLAHWILFTIYRSIMCNSVWISVWTSVIIKDHLILVSPFISYFVFGVLEASPGRAGV